MEEKKVKLSPPWYKYYHKLEALFSRDPDISLEMIDDYDHDLEIKMYVTNNRKAQALINLLPKEEYFGNNVSIKVTVIPGNKELESDAELVKAAFAGNPAVSFIETVDGLNPRTYVVFENKVVQYYNDVLRDYYGVTSTLYQDIAEEVLGPLGGISFCTDITKDNK